jgi:hypothetical protein
LTRAAAEPRVQAPDFQGEIRSELHRLGNNDLVRVIDALNGRPRPSQPR